MFRTSSALPAALRKYVVPAAYAGTAMPPDTMLTTVTAMNAAAKGDLMILYMKFSIALGRGLRSGCPDRIHAALSEPCRNPITGRRGAPPAAARPGQNVVCGTAVAPVTCPRSVTVSW